MPVGVHHSAEEVAAIEVAVRIAGQNPTGFGIVLLSAPVIYVSSPLLLNGTTNIEMRIEAGAVLPSIGIDLAKAAEWYRAKTTLRNT